MVHFCLAQIALDPAVPQPGAEKLIDFPSAERPYVVFEFNAVAPLELYEDPTFFEPALGMRQLTPSLAKFQ